MAKKEALGKGLGALLSDASKFKTAPANTISEIDLDLIDVNPGQPRTSFNDETLQELSQSIRKLGIVQPLTVRKVGVRYQIIAGERRYRASKLAGLKTIPAFVRDADDDNILELALVENIQREDLDPMEIAISYQRLMDECSLTQESLSERVGKKRATVANYMRLLKLPAEVQLGLKERLLQMGHARALLTIEDKEFQVGLYQQIIKDGLSVRRVEELARKGKKKKKNTIVANSEEYASLEEHLSGFFSSKVVLQRSKNGKGKITIPFRSDEELEQIIRTLDKKEK